MMPYMPRCAGRWLATALLMAGFLQATGCDCDCGDDMKKVRKKYGSPEEVYSYSSDGYYSRSWWYWSRGFQYEFTWGRHVSGCCDVSIFTFPPINYGASQAIKDSLMVVRDPQEREITWHEVGW